MIIVKLGGSVITDKRRKKTLRADNLRRLVRELTASEEELILVHGAGSFGHIEAKKYELDKGYSRGEQVQGVSEVQRDVRELNLKVVNALLDEGFRPVSLAPGSFITYDKLRFSAMDHAAFDDYLKLGAVPVSFGDVVRDRTKGFAICSGDHIMAQLAKRFKPHRAVFVTNVDGLFEANPSEDRNAKLIPVVTREHLSEIKSVHTDVDDVTGGMLGKIALGLEMAKSGVEVLVVNGDVEGRLRRALKDGDVVGTRIPPQG